MNGRTSPAAVTLHLGLPESCEEDQRGPKEAEAFALNGNVVDASGKGDKR
jgi:hypothetical protein